MRVLGIDAGGTKTVALLADGDGRVLGEGRAGGANLQGEGERTVEDALRGALRAVGAFTSALDAVCLGMAGMDREADRETALAILGRLLGRTPFLVVNDALVALTAGVGDLPGVVLVSGTGSIAYGRRGAVAARAGGWGVLLGDEGSGYWIGVRALRAVARAADGRGPETALTEKLLAHFAVARPSDLVPEAYKPPLRPHVVARLARAVGEARAEGDPVAAAILDEAAAELAAAAASVVTQLAMREAAFDFVLAGGVFEGVPWLFDELSLRLRAVASRARVVRLAGEPAMGAVRLALAEAQGGAALPRYAE